MQTFTTRSIAILGAALTATAGLAPAAFADVPKARVSYADLDVSSAPGQKALAHRIDRAVGAVCSSDEPSDALAVAACREKALTKAYADLQLRGVTVR